MHEDDLERGKRLSVPLESSEREALDRLCAASKRTRPKEIAFLIVQAARALPAAPERAAA